MRRGTIRKLDGIAMMLGAMLAPIIAWATDGAHTELGPIVGVVASSLGSGIAAFRLWLAPHPRTPHGPPPLPLPPTKED